MSNLLHYSTIKGKPSDAVISKNITKYFATVCCAIAEGQDKYINEYERELDNVLAKGIVPKLCIKLHKHSKKLLLYIFEKYVTGCSEIAKRIQNVDKFNVESAKETGWISNIYDVDLSKFTRLEDINTSIIRAYILRAKYNEGSIPDTMASVLADSYIRLLKVIAMYCIDINMFESSNTIKSHHILHSLYLIGIQKEHMADISVYQLKLDNIENTKTKKTPKTPKPTKSIESTTTTSTTDTIDE